MLVRLPRFLRTLLVACGLASFVGGADLMITTWSERGVPAQTITVCRATDVAKHPYQAANVRIANDGSLPSDIDTTRDVVPPYSYRGTNYPGVNWSAQGQAVWYAGCQGSVNALAAGESSAPTVVAAPSSPPPQLILGLWPPALFMQGAARVVAVALMVIGLLMIGVAGAGAPPEAKPSFVPVSSDLSMYSRPRIRPRRRGP